MGEDFWRYGVEENRKDIETLARYSYEQGLVSRRITVEELFGGRGRKTRRAAKPKFRNPADHAQTWSGRGKRPRWFNAALSAGKKEKDLLI